MRNMKLIAASLALILFSQFSLSALAGLFRMTERQEIMVGAQAATQVEKTQPILRDKTVTDYVSKLGRKLVVHSYRADIPYRFRVVNSKQVNAFALPGGFIYINRGLIEESETENELVGVIAHEIGHVAGRHGVTQVARAQKANLALGVSRLLLGRVRGGSTIFNGARLVTQGTFLKFSRDHERDADRRGAYMMHAAGWNAEGMVSFFDKLSKSGSSRAAAFLSTHPSPSERRDNVSDLIALWHGDGRINSQEFKNIKARLRKIN
ncbi:MAG: M48 family metallopeptidase [Candidatus Caenarcaniphilales bacterium]|nr:M48 family metallopeptidase [Candidatus Caenarcaniphilales bacterium]